MTFSSPRACWAMGAASLYSAAPRTQSCSLPVPVSPWDSSAGVSPAQGQALPLLHLCGSSMQRLPALKQNKIKNQISLDNFKFSSLPLHFMLFPRLPGRAAGRCLGKAREPAHPLAGLSRLWLLNCCSRLQTPPKVCGKERLFTRKHCITGTVRMERFCVCYCPPWTQTPTGSLTARM